MKSLIKKILIIGILGLGFYLNTNSAFALTITGSELNNLNIDVSGFVEAGREYCIFQNNLSLGCSSVSDDAIDNIINLDIINGWFGENNLNLPINVAITNAHDDNCYNQPEIKTWSECINGNQFLAGTSWSQTLSTMLNSITGGKLLTDIAIDFGLALLEIFGALIGIMVGFLIIKKGIHLIWHADGTTNWLGSHWSKYDQLTYSPWKGYKRYRSRKWNMEHTM